MEIVSKVCLGILGLVTLCLITGFVATWWEWSKRDKNKKG